MKIFILCLLFIITSFGSTQTNNSSMSENSDYGIPNSFSESQNNTPSTSNDHRVTPQAKEKEISNVSFCNLLKSPEKFEQQPVRLKAIFRRGFEKSEFYSLKCPTDKQVWV